MEKYKELIYIALGEASMQWIPRPSDQVFDSTGCNGVGERLIEGLEKEVPLAIKILTEALVNDIEYYYSWKANLVMAILDEFEAAPYYELDMDMKSISNRAAKRFLDSLIHQSSTETITAPNSGDEEISKNMGEQFLNGNLSL